MTLLFSDIRSFTDLSEVMTPEENFRFVNEYLTVMGPIVRRNHGFIDKYIGDAIMALFDNPDDAMNASVEMLEALGESGRMDGTVISDAVNLASRIEGLTKFYGIQCLISEAIYHSLSEPDKYLIRFVDKVKVKVKTVPVKIYEVYNANPLEIQGTV